MKKHFYAFVILLIGSITSAFSQSKVISGGYQNGAAICAKGKVFVWGDNPCGSLGIGTGGTITYPTQIPLPDNLTFSMLNAGSGRHFVALSCKSTVYCWGSNSDRQCGTTTNDCSSGGGGGFVTKPRLIPNGEAPGYNEDGTPGGAYLGNVKFVAATNNACFAVLNDGRVVGWGGGMWIAAATANPVFLRYPNGDIMTNVIHVAGGDDNVLVTVDHQGNGLGTLYYLGDYNGAANYRAQPLYKAEPSTPPREQLSNIRMAGMSDVSGFAVDVDGFVWSWGHGSYGCSTGRNQADWNGARLVPSRDYKAISGEEYLTDVKEIVGGNGYGLAVTKEGYVISWGPVGWPGECNGPKFLTYCDNGGTTGTAATRDTVKNAVHVGRGDHFGFMENDRYEFYAIGNNNGQATGVGVTTACFRKMNFDCEPIDPCPEVYMQREAFKCSGKPIDLHSGFITPYNKDLRYYFHWYRDGVRLNTSTLEEAKAYRKSVEEPEYDSVCDEDEFGEPINCVLTPRPPLPPIFDAYNNTRISVVEPGLYRVEVEYIGNNIPCDACPPVFATIQVKDKEMPIDTFITSVCVMNQNRPVASEDICFKFTSGYASIASEFELYLSETGGTPLQTFNLPASGNKTAEFCLTGEKVGVEKKTEDEIYYTIWLEDKTRDRGTLMGTPMGSPCNVNATGMGPSNLDAVHMQVTATKRIFLESFSVNVTSFNPGATITPYIYATQAGNAPYFRPNTSRIIAQGAPVTVTSTGELKLPINFLWEANARGITYFIGIRYSGTVVLAGNINCALPKVDDKDGESLKAEFVGQYGNDATSRQSMLFYNFIFNTLSSYDCGRMKLVSRYDCPCPDVAAQGPICSEDGSFIMTKTPPGVRGDWSSSNPAFTINEFGGVIIPPGLSADTDVTFRYTATSSGCWDEKTVRILAQCYEQICPADPFNPGVSDNLCFDFNIPSPTASSTYTAYDAATGGNAITTFSMGYGTQRRFCVSGDKIDKIHAIKQEGTDVKYSIWVDENILTLMPDTIIPATYDTTTYPRNLARSGTAACTAPTIYTHSGGTAPTQGAVYSNTGCTQIAGMYITATDSLKINSFAVQARSSGNGQSITTFSLRAVIYEVGAGSNPINPPVYIGAYTTPTPAPAANNGGAISITVPLGAGAGHLVKGKTYLISFEYQVTGTAPGIYNICYQGTFPTPTGFTIGTQTTSYNNISYDQIVVTELTPEITKPGALLYEPSNNRKEVNTFCESLCVQPAKLTTNNVVLCAGETPIPAITSRVSGLTTDHSLVWYSSDPVAVISAPVISNTNSGTDPIVITYYVSQRIDNCESEKEAITVTINPLPVLSSALLLPAICSGETFTYNAESATAGTSFNWSRTANANITEAASSGVTANISETLTSSSTGPVTVTYGFTLSANGCTNTNTQNVTVIVNPLPTVGITNSSGTTVLTCAAPSISLTATGGVSYSWDNGLGNNANATVDAIGTYTVTGTDANGCVNTANITITEETTPPTAGITNNSGTTVLTCAAPSISLTAIGGVSYSWDNGLGNNADATVTAIGTYTVTVTDANGCTDTESITITEDKVEPTVGITNNSGTTVLTCTVTSISLTATGGVSYSWDNGLGNNADATATTDGTYIVTVTAANGCTNTASITITEETTPPTADITNNSGTTVLTCAAPSISLTATGGVSYSWDNGLGNAANATVNAIGTYTVTVTGANDCTNTASITITEETTPPTVGITNNSGTTVLTCAAPSISLTATGGVSYSWDNGLGNAANATVDAIGTYTVTATDANGCTNTASITITADKTPPTAGITNNSGTTQLTCAAPSISLTATGGVSYSWNNGLGADADVTVTTIGTYTVTVTAANGCTDTESITIITDGTMPVAGIINNTSTTVLTCTVTSISLTATGGISYSWDNGLGINADATVTSAGTYTVTVMDTNGCTDTENITITEDKAEPDGSITNNSGTAQLTCTTTSISLTATGGVSYLWSNGDNIANTAITTAGTHNVIITGANGCTNTRSITIAENKIAPTADITNNSGTTVLTCAAPSISLTATGGVSYSWNNGLGNNAAATVMTAGTYIVTVTDANGCIDTKSITITEDKAEPDGGITNNSGTAQLTCTTTSISLTATGGVSYLWSNGDNIASTAIATAGTYNVIITGANGCTDTQSITITEDKIVPTAGITNNTGTTVLTCTTTSISLTATGGVSYSWDNGLGDDAAATVTTAGTYIVTVTGANGCTSTRNITITENKIVPTVSITNNSATTELTCAAPAISLTATGGISYSWDNGLGSNANATVNAPGTYIVTATAANGCTNTASITITENKTQPTAGITNNSATTVLTCAEPVISLTATGGVSYLWNNGLGNYANVTVMTAGTYTVTVTGANGCNATASITITTDGSRPTAGITNNTGVNVLTCTTTSISLTATGGVSYSWDKGLGGNANATVTSAGTYTVTVTDVNGCTDTESITITENKAEPNGAITNPVTTVLTCATPSISLTATGGVSYLWGHGDNTANTTITTAGTYTVTITGANGCTRDRNITITANGSLPTIVIATNPATTILTCTTPSITLTASGGVSYSWDNGLGNSASITVTSAGVYTVAVTSANGCSTTKDITITSNQSLPTVKANDAEICFGGETTLTASGANSYTWTTGETGASITVSPTASTTYTVEGTDTETGCKNTARAAVYVETPIGLTLDAPKSVELGNELTITITAERTDHGYFEWFINDQPYQTVSEYSLTLRPDAGRQHFLVHTATAKLDCPSSSEIYVEVSESVPNIINPYDPSGRNCCFMPGYRVEIYNRYMQKVFEGSDGWDGTYRGAVADPGTYFYRLYKKGGQVEKGTLEVVKF